MASTIILSDNGASSGSAGLKQTAGNDGVLILQTTTSGGTATNALYIDNSQNVGINMTPSAWGSSAGDALQMTGFAMWGSAGISHLSTNTYFDGTNYKYIDTGTVMDYYQYAGGHVFRASDSGTAGASVTTFANLIAVTKGQSLALQGASSQTGTGITFPATQSASTDANTLDDYEEGTWTPAYGRTGSAPTVSYTGVVGIYRKIGSFVWVAGRISTTSFTGGSGNLYLTGLPFTVATPGNDYGALSIGVSFGGWAAGQAPTAGYPTQSSTQIILATYDSADPRNGLDVRITTIAASGNGLVFSCCYYTS